jgi:hypothetical protein
VTINSYFDKVFCINLDRRTDRLQRVQAEAVRYGIQFERHVGAEPSRLTRKPLSTEERAALVPFGPTLAGCPLEARPYGTMGTTLSHRMLLRKVAEGPWPRVLVLEDDFHVITPKDKPGWFGNGLPDDFQARFDLLASHVPGDWDVLYLGGGYGNPPLGRVDDYCLRVDLMLTTSSYGITRKYAEEWSNRTDEQERLHKEYDGTRYSAHIGLIDHMVSRWAREANHYAVQPRLMIQAADYSDATQRQESYVGSMTDEQHERLV